MRKSAIHILCLALPCIMALAEIDKKWLENIMIREGPKEGITVEKLVSMKLSPADLPGTVFGSNRTRAELDLLLKDGKTVKKSVVVIALPSDPIREKQIADTGLFEVDINVYEHVLPRMEKLLNKKGHKNKMWVKALDLEKYSKIVIEDWEEKDYHLEARWVGLDMDQCKIAIKNLAGYHALSVVLKSQNLIPTKPFDLSLGQRNKDKIGDWYGKVFLEFAKSIRAAWGAGYEKTAQAFEEKSKTITNDVLDITKRDESKLNALQIGAFYINNIFFKTDDAKKPTSIKTINFQNSFWNSPALDLQLFLNTSPRPELMTVDLKRDEIVDHYVKNLAKYLQEFGYSESVTKEELSSEIKRTELVGLANAIDFLSGIYRRPEDAAYAEQFIIDALKTKQIIIDSKGMILPRFVEVMKKLVDRAQKLGVIKV